MGMMTREEQTRKKEESKGKMGPYTLFSVTHETRESRSARIRELFRTQPVLGYLVAVFDFEWTIRRAVVMMSPCPSPIVKAHFSIRRRSGWRDYRICWRDCVQRMRDDVIPTLGRVAYGGPVENDMTDAEKNAIQAAMELRHKLVHGLSGNLPRAKADVAFELLMSATERIVQFVEDSCKKSMFSRIHKPQTRCKKCRKHCDFNEEQKRAQALAKKEKREARRQGGWKK